VEHLPWADLEEDPDPVPNTARHNLESDTTPQPAIPLGPVSFDPRASQEVFTSARPTAEVTPAQRQAFGAGVQQAQISTHIVEVDVEQQRNTRIVDVSVPGIVRKAAARRTASQGGAASSREQSAEGDPLNESIDRLSDSAHMIYARMHRVDRVTFVVNFLTFIAAFLPWRHVLGEGLVSGIEGLGAACAGFAALIALFIYIRTARRRLAGLVLLLQLICAAGVVAVPVYLFFYQPGLGFHVGLYATALCGALVIFLTFVRMAVRS